jgi:hypothetical protein
MKHIIETVVSLYIAVALITYTSIDYRCDSPNRVTCDAVMSNAVLWPIYHLNKVLH